MRHPHGIAVAVQRSEFIDNQPQECGDSGSLPALKCSWRICGEVEGMSSVVDRRLFIFMAELAEPAGLDPNLHSRMSS
jgi:hypothetical protein